MKKIMMMAAAVLMAGCAVAQDVQLPEPNKNVAMTLMDALQQRTSQRSYSDKAVDDATLSQVLWAACGINRPDSKRITAPSAINAQDILLYVLRADGAFLYQPISNSLKKVCSEDLRQPMAGPQQFAADAPVGLLLVSDQSKFRAHAERYGAMDAGYVSENIYLACTALGLNTVARAMMDAKVLSEKLGLAEHLVPMLNHPIGWPK